MIKNSKIGVIILAAGSSSRLGNPKQLVEFKGKTLLQQMIDLTDSFVFDTKIVVLGANSDKIKKNIDLKDFEPIINEFWKDGMSSSIKKGLKASLNIEKKLEQLLILLSDQPFITRENIEELVRAQQNGTTPAVFSEYAGEVGVPAIFSAEVFPYLRELEGDTGAKKLIINKKFEYQTVKFEEGNFDVDTKEDVERLKHFEKE